MYTDRYINEYHAVYIFVLCFLFINHEQFLKHDTSQPYRISFYGSNNLALPHYLTLFYFSPQPHAYKQCYTKNYRWVFQIFMIMSIGHISKNVISRSRSMRIFMHIVIWTSRNSINSQAHKKYLRILIGKRYYDCFNLHFFSLYWGWTFFMRFFSLMFLLLRCASTHPCLFF